MPRFQAIDQNGRPMVGSTLYTYQNKTTTPHPTWKDKEQTAYNTNPIVLDARGEAVVWLDPEQVYTFVLRDWFGALVWSQDDVAGGASQIDLAAPGGSGMVGFIQAGSGAVARTSRDKMREIVSIKDFGAVGDGATDDVGSWEKFLTAARGRLASIPDGTYFLSNGVSPFDYELHDCLLLISPGASFVIGDWSADTVFLQIGSNCDIQGVLKVSCSGTVSANGFVNVPICIGRWWDASTEISNVKIGDLFLSQGDAASNLLVIAGNVRDVKTGHINASGSFSRAVLAHWSAVPNNITPTASYHPHDIYISGVHGNNASEALVACSAAYNVTVGNISGANNLRGLFSIGGDFGGHYAVSEQKPFICKGITVESFELIDVGYSAIEVNASAGLISYEMGGNTNIKGGVAIGKSGSSAGISMHDQICGEVGSVEISGFGSAGVLLRNCVAVAINGAYAHGNGGSGFAFNGAVGALVNGCSLVSSISKNNNQDEAGGVGEVSINASCSGIIVRDILIQTNNASTHGVVLNSGSVNCKVEDVRGIGFSSPRYVLVDLNTPLSTNVVREVTSDGPTVYSGPIANALRPVIGSSVRQIQGSATYTIGSLNDGIGATFVVTVPGAEIGDYVLMSFSNDLLGLTATAWVSAANTVSVRLQNETGSTVDVGSGTFRIRAFKQ